MLSAKDARKGFKDDTNWRDVNKFLNEFEKIKSEAIKEITELIIAEVKRDNLQYIYFDIANYHGYKCVIIEGINKNQADDMKKALIKEVIEKLKTAGYTAYLDTRELENSYFPEAINPKLFIGWAE